MATSVSILLPVYNEIDHIDSVLGSLLTQDYEAGMEIVIADGMSTDGTLGRIVEWQERTDDIVLLRNERRSQSHGLNLAASRASGEILVRADGHTVYEHDYVRRSVDALERTRGTAVGGNLRPAGNTAFGRAVARAMSSPLAIGPGKFHYADDVHEVDTVYLGAYRASDFARLGGYRHLPSGVAEDADLYYRWRTQGARIVLDPSIRSTYRPRETFRAFLRQSWRYGVGKAEMLYLNGRFPSWRPLAPLGLVTGLLAGAALGVATGIWLPLAGLAVAWLTLVGIVALRAQQRVRVAIVVATMHLSYGAGLLWGVARGPGPLRHID